MMKLTATKKPSKIKGVELFYVTSEADPTASPYFVTIINSQYYCQCGDFFIRHLPFLGTALFSLCKHARFVRDTKNISPKGAKLAAIGGVSRIEKTGYEVWVKAVLGNEDRQKPRRSRDVSGIFLTKAAAERAIKTTDTSLPKSEYYIVAV